MVASPFQASSHLQGSAWVSLDHSNLVPNPSPKKQFCSEMERGTGKEQNQSREMEEIGICRSAHSFSGSLLFPVVHAQATLKTEVL